MKKLSFLRMILPAVFLLAVFLPGRALAAGGYRGEHQSNGTVNVVDEKTGEVAANLAISGKSVNVELAASGSKIYFTAYKTVGYQTVNYLYTYDLKKGYIRYLRTLPKGCYTYDCNEVYDGYVYLSGWNPSDNIMLYRCKTSGKNLKKIVGKAGYAARYGRYILCNPCKVMGSFVRYSLYVFDTETGKAKTAVKNIGSYSRSGKYVYAAVMPKDGYPGDGANYRIVRYNLTTGKSATVVKSMKAYFIGRISAKYVWYHTGGGYDTAKYYRYAIADGTRKTITRAAYEKAVGIN